MKSVRYLWLGPKPGERIGQTAPQAKDDWVHGWRTFIYASFHPSPALGVSLPHLHPVPLPFPGEKTQQPRAGCRQQRDIRALLESSEDSSDYIKNNIRDRQIPCPCASFFLPDRDISSIRWLRPRETKMALRNQTSQAGV